MMRLAIAASLAMSSICAGGVLELRAGKLGVEVDEGTGGLVAIRYGERVLAKGDAGVFPITFATGAAGAKPVWVDSTGVKPVLTRHARPAPGVMELTITAGEYELVETYRVREEASWPARLDRSVRLTYRGTHQEPVKLREMYFRTAGVAVENGGFARFPGTWPAVSYPFANMKAGTWRGGGGGGSISPAGLQLDEGLTLLFASHTQDSSWLNMIEGEGSVEIRQTASAQGMLKPGVPQEIGFVSMLVAESGYWEALPKLWDWMDEVGMKVPADRPDWVNGAVLYGFHPGGTIGSGFKDLGGFTAATERLLPELPRLGVTALWVLPIESQSPYWPKDYYTLMDGIGTFEQYRAMVARAHELKLKVLQDLVPHGGAPWSVHNVARPEFMLRKEDGSTFDYWLNDFGNPDWQKYIADVARHYVKNYGVDGYRIDACYGSKEPNWSPEVRYARASLAVLQGGLGMVQGIRNAVREIKPKEGAVLAEVESARHAVCSDMQYDFALCYNVLPQWGKMPAGDFAAQLQEYLEERKYTYPRGTILMRHVESHDSLRSQMWYGIGGMRAMYALTAWIDGVPLMYQNMEIGHSEALAAINAVRARHPEIARGEALYRAVKCDTPGVFTCLRKLDGQTSVIAINFTRETVTPRISWNGQEQQLTLFPLGYAVFPDGMNAPMPQAESSSIGPNGPNLREVSSVTSLEGATEWFVDTIEGRLRGTFSRARTSGETTTRDGIYWRDQIPSLLWRGDMLPLDPVAPRIGYKTADGIWHEIRFKDAESASLRLVERQGGREGLFVLGAENRAATMMEVHGTPPHRDVYMMQPVQLGAVQFRCAGNELLISNGHYAVTLRRQGGLVRQMTLGDGRIVRPLHDLYGDQKAFETGTSKTINASSDAECGLRIRVVGDELHLRFEGQLRGMDRFALKSPPVWYYNEYVFGKGRSFRNHLGFKSDGAIANQPAFLSFFLPHPGGDGFRFIRRGERLFRGQFKAEAGRQGQTHGTPLPDRIEFLQGDRPLWSIHSIECSDGIAPNLFVDGQNLFLTLLDGNAPAMEKDRWYEFGCVWEP